MSTAEILVIAENKERKNLLKEALNADKSIGLRVCLSCLRRLFS